VTKNKKTKKKQPKDVQHEKRMGLCTRRGEALLLYMWHPPLLMRIFNNSILMDNVTLNVADVLMLFTCGIGPGISAIIKDTPIQIKP
jgi:hypothetical protein